MPSSPVAVFMLSYTQQGTLSCPAHLAKLHMTRNHVLTSSPVLLDTPEAGLHTHIALHEGQQGVLKHGAEDALSQVRGAGGPQVMTQTTQVEIPHLYCE